MARGRAWSVDIHRMGYVTKISKSESNGAARQWSGCARFSPTLH